MAVLPSLVGGVAVQSVPANSSLNGILASGAILATLDGHSVASTKDIYSTNLTANPQAVFEKDGKQVQTALMELVVQSVDSKHPASGVLQPEDRILTMDGKTVRTTFDVHDAVTAKKPGESLAVGTQRGVKTVTVGADGKLGIQVALSSVAVLDNRPKAGNEHAYAALSFLLVIFSWTFLLNILIGIVNLLPLFITDGQKMIYYELVPRFGKDKAAKLSTAAGIAMLALVALNALPYFLR